MAAELTPLSANNPRIADLRRLLGRRRARTDSGRFVIEGPNAVRELLLGGFTFDEVFVDVESWEKADDRSVLREIVRLATDVDIPLWGVPSSVFVKISDTESPQGVIATAPIKTTDVADLFQTNGALIALVNINDPGNAGTIMRAAEAFGAAGVIFIGEATDPFGPKAVRAAAGSLCRLPIAIVDSPTEFVKMAAARQFATVATVVDGGERPEDCALAERVVVLFGSEAHGLDDSVISLCSHRLTIPMAATVESINVATAASVLLFEIARQRR